MQEGDFEAFHGAMLRLFRVASKLPGTKGPMSPMNGAVRAGTSGSPGETAYVE